jgi:hypothetical protein
MYLDSSKFTKYERQSHLFGDKKKAFENPYGYFKGLIKIY